MGKTQSCEIRANIVAEFASLPDRAAIAILDT
jgi:hypothetical protein